jgi:hypothetical protein
MKAPLRLHPASSPLRRAVGRLLPWAAGSSLLLCAAEATAAEWHVPTSALPHAGGPLAAAEAYLHEAEPLLGLGSVELVPRVVLELGSYRTVRFEQRYAGLPVLDTSVAVRVDGQGRVRVVVLEVARTLAVDPVPALTGDEARAIVLVQEGLDPGAPASSDLAVLPDGTRAGRLVWVVDVPGSRGAVRHLVDAVDGRILLRKPLAKDVKGRVYQVSSVATPTPIDADLDELVVASPQMLNGWAGQLAVTNYVSGSQTGGSYVFEQTLQPNSGEDFLYDPPADPHDATDGFAQVSLYYHLTRIHHFFATTYNLNMTTAPWKLVAAANGLEGGQPLDNAFFAPQGAAAPYNYPNMIMVGQGTSFDFAQDSDVFLHEFTHYVSHNAVGFSQGQFEVGEWGFNFFPGAVDEGTADYFACTINGDPELGEASLALLGSPRDLTDASKSCPNDLIGEVHADGELVGSLSWTLHTALGAASSDQVVWGAITLLPTGGSLGDYGAGLVQTANDLVTQGLLTAADVTTVQDAVAQRGLDDCGHELAVSATEPRTTTMFGLGTVGQGFGMTCAQLAAMGVHGQSLFHFVATPAPADTGVRFQVGLEVLGQGDVSWSIYARRDEHVSFSAVPPVGLPAVDQYDYKVENLTATNGELVIDANSDPPFVPTSTYHMVIVHQNCPNTRATVTSAPLGEGGAGGAGGAGPEPQATAPTEVDGGCGCRVTAPSDATPRSGVWASLALLAPLAAAVRRRMRRRG